MAKILYVEDNEDNVYMMTRRLKRLGFEVIVAADGQRGTRRERVLVCQASGHDVERHRSRSGHRQMSHSAGCEHLRRRVKGSGIVIEAMQGQQDGPRHAIGLPSANRKRRAVRHDQPPPDRSSRGARCRSSQSSLSE
jgi:CheY-like chemotaxis protein